MNGFEERSNNVTVCRTSTGLCGKSKCFNVNLISYLFSKVSFKLLALGVKEGKGAGGEWAGL